MINERIAPFIDFPAPLYLAPPNGRPAFHTQHGTHPWPIFIISIPKSGTYLIGELLTRLGAVSAGVHLWETGFHDYRDRTIQEMVEKYNEFEKTVPFATSARLILPGQFAVGHLFCNEENKKILAPFRSFFSYRELRACLVSHMRWYMKPGRGGPETNPWKSIPNDTKRMEAFLVIHGKLLIEWYRLMLEWRNDPAVMPVSFEVLSGDKGKAEQLGLVRRMAAHIGIDGLDDAAAQEHIDKVLGAETKTWSGKRSSLKDYWSKTCEMVFDEFGGTELNRKLGY